MDQGDREPVAFSSKESAAAEHARLAQMLPPQKSAYRPSGKMAPIGWLMLPTVGLAAGIAGAVLAGTVVALVGGLITSFSLHFSSLTVIVYPICALFTLFFLCAAPGFGAAAGLGMMSAAAKNRNVVAAMLVGFVSGVGGAYVLCRMVLPYVAGILIPILPEMPQTILVQGAGMTPVMIVWGHETLSSVASLSTASWVAFYLSGAAGGIMAMLGAASTVQSAKFCEACGQFIKSRPLSFLSLEGAKNLVSKLGVGAPTRSDVMAMDGNGVVTVNLFQCDQCKEGYLEVTLAFHAKWPSPKNKDKFEKMSKSWIVGSRAVSRAEAAALEGDSSFDGPGFARASA
jgi:hypothetical protein